MTTEPGWLTDQLPRTMADDDFTRRFVSIFEEVAGTVRSRIDQVPEVFDVGLAPLEFVRWMASWVGQSIDPSVPEDRQRSLAILIGPLFPKRGTRRGIEEMLEALTLSEVNVTDSGGIYIEGAAPDADPHVEIRVSDTGEVAVQQLLRIVQNEVPADTTVDLIVGSQTIESEHDTEEMEAMVSEAIPESAPLGDDHPAAPDADAGGDAGDADGESEDGAAGEAPDGGDEGRADDT